MDDAPDGMDVPSVTDQNTLQSWYRLCEDMTFHLN